MFECRKCGLEYSKKEELDNHVCSNKIVCNVCSKEFDYFSFYKRHVEYCKKQKKINYFLQHEETINSNLAQTAELIKAVKELKESNEYLKKVNCTLESRIKDQQHLSAKCTQLETDLVSSKAKCEDFERKSINLEIEVGVLKNMIDLQQNKLSENKFLNLTLQLNQFNEYHNSNEKINYKTIVQKLPCVSNSGIDNLFKNLPVEVLESVKQFTDYVGTNYLNKRVVCTDLARGTIAWKDEDQKIIKDKHGSLLTKKIKNIGKENKPLLDGLLDIYDKKMDQTNSNNILSINNKNNTVVGLTKNNTWFEGEFTKNILPHTRHVKQFKDLPKSEPENFTKYIKNWLLYFKPIAEEDNYEIEVKVNLSKFLEILFEDGFKIVPNKRHDMISLYLECINKKIMCFMDCCNCYFCDDSNNIMVDYKGSIVLEIIRDWLRKNMAPNASKTNHANCFDFSEQDIREITNQKMFETTCFETFYNFIHCFKVDCKPENAVESDEEEKQ
jgi:hypothetical protein